MAQPELPPNVIDPAAEREWRQIGADETRLDGAVKAFLRRNGLERLSQRRSRSPSGEIQLSCPNAQPGRPHVFSLWVRGQKRPGGAYKVQWQCDGCGLGVDARFNPSDL